MMMMLLLVALLIASMLGFALGWYYGHLVGYQEGRSAMNKQWRSMIHEKVPLLSLVQNQRPGEGSQPEARESVEAA